MKNMAEAEQEVFLNDIAHLDKTAVIIGIVICIWFVLFIIQAFLAYGTAYRCTKKGNDNGFGLFVYLIGFTFAALVPGLGLHYYIKHLPPKIVVEQKVQPQVIRVIDPSQLQGNAQVQQAYQENNLDMQAYQAMQQRQMQQQQAAQQMAMEQAMRQQGGQVYQQPGNAMPSQNQQNNNGLMK